MKKNEKSLRNLFDEDSELLEKAFQAMSAAVAAYIDEKYEEAKLHAHETIKIEKEQDRLREVLIDRLFSKETMVFSRADRLKIIEQMDKIVDECEIVVRKLLQFMPDVPQTMESDIVAIVQNNRMIGTELKVLVGNVLDDFSLVKTQAEKIQNLRREIRETHWKLLEINYQIPHKSFFEFNYFRELVKALAKVADRAEEFSDQLYGFVCKYSL